MVKVVVLIWYYYQYDEEAPQCAVASLASREPQNWQATDQGNQAGNGSTLHFHGGHGRRCIRSRFSKIGS